MCQYIQRSPAHLHPLLDRLRVAGLAAREECVERGLEVVFLEEAALDGRELVGTFDAVADLTGDALHSGARAGRDLRRLARRRRARSRAKSAIV